MSVTLRPLNDRVLIRPEKQPEQTESGLHLVEHAKPEQMGEVVAVGRPVHPLRGDAESTADYIDSHGYHDQAALLRSLVAREPCVKPGDTVLFSWNVGHEIRLEDDGDTLLLMREDDLLAVIES